MNCNCTGGPNGMCPCMQRGFYQFTPYQPQYGGWACPKCNSIYAPAVHECWRCNSQHAPTVTSFSISTPASLMWCPALVGSNPHEWNDQGKCRHCGGEKP